jgi:hypothetical protein
MSTRRSCARVLEYYRFRPKTHGSENNALTFLKLKSKTGNGPVIQCIHIPYRCCYRYHPHMLRRVR